jgi:hypothetical protein
MFVSGLNGISAASCAPGIAPTIAAADSLANRTDELHARSHGEDWQAIEFGALTQLLALVLIDCVAVHAVGAHRTARPHDVTGRTMNMNVRAQAQT